MLTQPLRLWRKVPQTTTVKRFPVCSCQENVKQSKQERAKLLPWTADEVVSPIVNPTLQNQYSLRNARLLTINGQCRDEAAGQ